MGRWGGGQRQDLDRTGLDLPSANSLAEDLATQGMETLADWLDMAEVNR